MWKFLKMIGHLLKGLFWLVFLFAMAGLVVLYRLENGVPASLLRQLETAISTDDIHVRIERATFSLKNGVRLFRVKALPKRVAGHALVSVDEVALDIALAPGLAFSDRLHSVTLKNVAMPALPHRSRPRDAESPPFPALPVTGPFPLTVEKADILGIKVTRLTASVATSEKRVDISDIAIRLPSPSAELEVTGEAGIDLAAQSACGTARGQVFPENLLPLFTTLKARGAVEQVSCFSKLERPVNATYDFNVGLDTSDFTMRLDIDAGPCAYRGVPMACAKGSLDIYGTNVYTTVVINRFDAQTAAGAPLSGSLTYDEKTEGVTVDGTTTMDTKPLSDILNILNHGELDRIRCATPPTISAQGTVAVSPATSAVTNNLAGKISFPAGTILNFEARDVTADFALSGYSAHISNIAGSSLRGGTLTGDTTFFFPGYAATATVFTANLRLSDIALEDIAHAFSTANDRSGAVSGSISLSGPAHADTVKHLSGEGSFSIQNGDLNRIKLFAGLTDYLSRNIPGISALVDQSAGSLTFTIKDGVLKTDDLLIEGTVFSIGGRGSYDIAADKLDFSVRANIFKQKTFLGRITRLVTVPFSRLLLEFKVFGSLENPDWSYVNVIERITDVFTSSADTE